MQKTALAFTLLALVGVSAVNAEEPTTGKSDRVNADAVEQTMTPETSSPEKPNKLAFLRFATVVSSNEAVLPGDYIKISRKFSNWNLRCDLRLSSDRRACFIEQVGGADGTSAVWRVAQNEQGQAIAMLSLPADTDVSAGVGMSFAGLEKTLKQDDFLCTSQACLGGFLFEGFVQSAIMQSSNVGISLTRKGGTQQTILMSMEGFLPSLDAAARDPFGRDVTYKVKDDKAKAALEAKKKPKGQAVSKAQKSSPAQAAKPKSKSDNVAKTESDAPKAVGLY